MSHESRVMSSAALLQHNPGDHPEAPETKALLSQPSSPPHSPEVSPKRLCEDHNEATLRAVRAAKRMIAPHVVICVEQSRGEVELVMGNEGQVFP